MSHKLANGRHFVAHTDGFGDIKLNTQYRVHRNDNFDVILSLGVRLPTGEIDERGKTPAAPNGVRLPYPMQLSSGTYDLIPGISIVRHNDVWGYGMQVQGTLRLHFNNAGYNQGNAFLANAWISRKVIRSLSFSARLELNSWGDYEGHDDTIHASRRMVPTADNDRHGGMRLDAHLGMNYLFTDGILEGHSLGLEAGILSIRSLRGPNLETDLTATIGWQYRL